MKIGQMALKVFLLIIANEVLDTVAQLLMKRGLVHFSMGALCSPGGGLFCLNSPDTLFLALGVFVYALTFFMWIMILREADLSIALPVGSTAYILIPIAAMVFFHEHVGFFRWVGIGFIVLGICFVSYSKPSRERSSLTDKMHSGAPDA